MKEESSAAARGASQAYPPAPELEGWVRAMGFATGLPDPAEALVGILSEAVPLVGAHAALAVEGVEGVCRGVWGCDADDSAVILTEHGPVRCALQRQEEWIDSALVITRDAHSSAVWPEGIRHLALAPLRARGQGTGALVLLFGDVPPTAPALSLAGSFAALVALVLENERLYHEARTALQARDHFLTALNHELRTPATALLLEADMLSSGVFGALPARLADALRNTEAHVQELIGALRRVLDLGQIEEEATPGGMDVLQPRQAVAALLRRIEPAAKRKSLSLSLFTPRNLPPLQTDVPRVSRILLHLLSNAIKYTAHGGVEVRLERTFRTLSRFKQEPVLMVRVKDTGCGIPAHELERIFEPFAQVEEGARTNSRTRGVGLGLPLARQLARSLGGDVLVESDPGGGTVASLMLPYQQRLGSAG